MVLSMWFPSSKGVSVARDWGYGPLGTLGPLVLGTFLVACQRVPEEPPSHPTVYEASTQPLQASVPMPAAKRCIRDLPSAPPPAVASIPKGRCPKDPDPRSADLPLVNLVVPEDPSVRIEAELAQSSDELQKGLMYRTEMAESRGMLFRLASRIDHTFWMRNTCLSLDMLFLDDDGTIVGILENVPPLNEVSRSVGCPSSFVLEMNAGWSRRHGIRPGRKLGLPAAAR